MPSAQRVLVVDDDFAIREAIADVLVDEGYTVTCAANGREALTRLEAGEAPGLIVLDLMMPVMDGWAFRSALQHDPRLAKIPVIVVSAGAGDRRTVADLGADAFLPKPFNLEHFVSTVHRLAAS